MKRQGRMFSAAFAVMAGMLVVAAPVAAAVDFEVNATLFPASNGSVPIHSGGFTFTTTFYQGVVNGLSAYGADNGSNYLAYYAGAPGVLRFFKDDGAPFSLASLDLGASVNFGGNDTLHVTGYREAGGTVDTLVTISTTALATVSLGAGLGFSDLSMVEVGSAARYPGYVVLDNIVLASPIPEPTNFALLLAGLGLAGVAARRKRLPDVAHRA